MTGFFNYAKLKNHRFTLVYDYKRWYIRANLMIIHRFFDNRISYSKKEKAMKRLIKLFMQDKFKFAKQEREKLGLKQNDIFKVLLKYTKDRISVENIRTTERQEFSGDFLIIPEPGNRTDKIMTQEEAEEAIKYIRKGENRE